MTRRARIAVPISLSAFSGVVIGAFTGGVIGALFGALIGGAIGVLIGCAIEAILGGGKPVNTEHDSCVFCKIVNGTESADIVRVWPDAVAIVPLDPVTEGHILVIPRVHVNDVTEDPRISATTMGQGGRTRPRGLSVQRDHLSG